MEWDDVITLEGLDRFSEDEFFHFCSQNQNLRIERQADGTVTIMSPAGFQSDELNAEIIAELKIWSRTYPMGIATGSSAGFILQDTSMLSPDAAWTSTDRLMDISAKGRQKFLHACPNFIVELLSPSDSLKALKRKMELWLKNGVEVGWLINPRMEVVIVYEEGKTPITVKGFDQSISCPEVLPGFELDLRYLRPKMI